MTLTEALAKLHAAGRIRSPWLPGQTAGDMRYDDGIYDSNGLPGEPDLTDPATVGCLLALLREASGDPLVSPDLVNQRWRKSPGLTRKMFWTGPAEGLAISAALIALAESLS